MSLSVVLKQGHGVRVVSVVVGPRWKHENGTIASLPVAIANKGA